MIIRAPAAVLDRGLRACSVAVRSGRIAAVLGDGEPAQAARVAELAADEVLLPGLVDTHVHINEPGRTEWEGFATATRAAAAGGVTTLIDMPLNSIPPTTDPQALAVKQAAARGQCHVDTGFWGGAVPASLGRLRELHDAGPGLGTMLAAVHTALWDLECQAAQPAAVGREHLLHLPLSRAPCAGRCDVVQADVVRVGGITPWMEIAVLAGPFPCPWPLTSSSSSRPSCSAASRTAACWRTWKEVRPLCTPGTVSPSTAPGKKTCACSIEYCVLGFSTVCTTAFCIYMSTVFSTGSNTTRAHSADD